MLWKGPDEEGLVKFLVEEKNFNEERVKRVGTTSAHQNILTWLASVSLVRYLSTVELLCCLSRLVRIFVTRSDAHAQVVLYYIHVGALKLLANNIRMETLMMSIHINMENSLNPYYNNERNSLRLVLWPSNYCRHAELCFFKSCGSALEIAL